jgi:hypothetical protein
MKAFAIALGFTVLIVGAIATAFLYEELWNWPFNDQVFSRNVWLASAGQARARMADDLVRTLSTRSMSSNEVVQMLGPGENLISNDGMTTYYIGGWSGYRGGADDNWITIEWSADGRVRHAYIDGG